MSNTLPLTNLKVVDFYADRSKLSDEMKRWMDKNLNATVLGAENCERRVWMGPKEAFDYMPDISKYESPKIYAGAEAYAFMLQYMSGLINPYGLDRPANERFYLAWDKMNRRNSKQSRYLTDLLSKLCRDSEFIIKNVCSGILPIRPWLIAREMSKQAEGDTVIVIGGLNEAGTDISAIAQRMIVTANGGEVGMPTKLICIFPDDLDKSITEAKIKSLKKQGKLRIEDVVIEDIENLPILVEGADAIYVTEPAGKDFELDMWISDTWRNRSSGNGALIHTNISEIIDESTFSEMHGYVSASRLKAIHHFREDGYQSLRMQAEEIARDMGESRAIGGSPCRETMRYKISSSRQLVIA